MAFSASLEEDMAGQKLHNFLAYVIHEGEDIDDVEAALRVEIIEGWAIFDRD